MALIGMLVVLVLAPVVAAPLSNGSWSVGVNLGTSAQAATQYRVNDMLDIVAGIGYEFYWGALYGDVTANFKVWEFAISDVPFDLTVGGGALVGLYNNEVELSLVAPVGITYSLADDVFPVDIYFRLGPAFRILKGYQTNFLGVYSYVGAMYRF